MSPTIKILIVAIASASYGTYGYCILKKWKAEDKRGVKPNEGQTRFHLTIIALGSTGLSFLYWIFFRHIGIYANIFFLCFVGLSSCGTIFFGVSFLYWHLLEKRKAEINSMPKELRDIFFDDRHFESSEEDEYFIKAFYKDEKEGYLKCDNCGKKFRYHQICGIPKEDVKQLVKEGVYLCPGCIEKKKKRRKNV